LRIYNQSISMLCTNLEANKKTRNKENKKCLPHTEHLIDLNAKLVQNFIQFLHGVIFNANAS
jgi:hypothetical protein